MKAFQGYQEHSVKKCGWGDLTMKGKKKKKKLPSYMDGLLRVKNLWSLRVVEGN